MGDITLSAGVRQNLLALQNTADLFTQTSNRLATGKKVNSALDNPNSFFTAQSLQGRASDLSNLLDAESNAVQTVQAANQGITAIQKLVDSAKALANQALQTSNTTTRADLSTQFGDLLTQIDQLAADTSYHGINLLNGDNLKVVFNESSTSSLTIKGVKFDSTGLGLTAITGNGFQDNNVIDTTLDTIQTALTSLRTQAANFGSNETTVEARQDFTKDLINTLQTGADNLVLADTNQEGANLLALQTRQQLSITSLSLASQADQAILKVL